MKQWSRFLKTGVNRDAQRDQIPLDMWGLSDNVLFHDGAAEPLRDGRVIWSETVANTKQPYFLLYAPTTGGVPYWIGGWSVPGSPPVVRKWYGTSAFTSTDITSAAWAAVAVSGRNSWTGGTLNGVAVMNCALNLAPHYYDTTAGGLTTTILPGWGGADFCGALRPYRYHLVAMNMQEAGTNYPQKLRWSNSAAPGTLPTTWTPAATNDSGDAQLSDTPGNIVDGLRLGDSFMLYKRSAVYRMNYVGGNEVMQIVGLSRLAGVIARNCVADIGGAHAVLAPGDVFLVAENGEIKSIADGMVKRRLSDLVDGTNQQSCFVGYNPCRKELWCLVSTGGVYSGAALVYDVPSGRWSECEPLFTATGAFLPSCAGTGPASQLTDPAIPADDRLVIGMAGSRTTMANTWVSLNDPTATTSNYLQTNSDHTLEAYNVELGTPDAFKLITALKMIGSFAAGTSIEINVYTKLRREDSGTFNGPYTFVAGTNNRVDLLLSGRFFDFQFVITSLSTEAPWRIAGFEIEWQEQGPH
jgi:hypothetical protein